MSPIRFAPRQPVDPKKIPHLDEVAALCSPRYDEVQDQLGCAKCPGDEGFELATPTLEPKVERGPLRWRVHHVFEGRFSSPDVSQAILATEGCEWRSNGAIVVTKTEKGWVAGQYMEGVPFGAFSKCSVAKSPRWGDTLVCEGTLLTHSVGTRMMRGSSPYAWTVTTVSSLPGTAQRGQTALSDLLVGTDPEACQSPGARGAVIRTELVNLRVEDRNDDGQDDLTVEIRYLVAASANRETCNEDAGLVSAKLGFVRRQGGFFPDASADKLIRRLRLR